MKPIGSRRQPQKGLIAIVAIASLAVHAVFAAVVAVRAPDVHAPVAPKTMAAAAAEVEADVSPSCRTEAALAAAAQSAVCLSPFAGDGCFDRLERDLDAWVSECEQLLVMEEEQHQREEVPVKIAFLDASALEKLQPIPIQPLLDPQRQKQLQEQEKQRIEKKAEEARKQRMRKVARGQVVEVTQPKVEMTPDKARFVSEFDTAVEKETVARGSTEKMVDRPGPKELPVADEQKLPEELVTPPPELTKADQAKTDFENPKGTGKLDMRAPGREKQPEIPRPKKVGYDDGSVDPLTANGLARTKGDRPLRMTERPRITAPGEGGEEGERGRPKVPDLRPSEELLSRVAGGGSVDKLDGVESGDRTALNSKKWKYASFFNRLKRQVAQNWRPNEVYLARDPNGNVYGVKDRITVVKVDLQPSGKIAAIHVVRGSGVDFLDDEAVRAFRAAAPFPNPPGGLVDAQSNVITFTFGFHFQIGGSRSNWKIFRYR